MDNMSGIPVAVSKGPVTCENGSLIRVWTFLITYN